MKDVYQITVNPDIGSTILGVTWACVEIMRMTGCTNVRFIHNDSIYRVEINADKIGVVSRDQTKP